MDKAYDRGKGIGQTRVRWSLCRILATLALEDQNAEMLKAILDVHDRQLEWEFHRTFDSFEHEGGDPEIIRIVKKSGFKSMIPPGKRFSDMHPLDYL
jgi:hypothetical protein